MSQSTESSESAGSAAMTGEEFLEAYAEARQSLAKKGARSGPVYSESGAVSVIYDQVFGRGITPSGSVECPEALACGCTGQALQVALVASHGNEGAVVMASGATASVSFLASDKAAGEFAAAGPAITVTAPAAGLSAEPDLPLLRLPIPDGLGPWLKVKLTFGGTISGGKVDCVLAMAAR